MIKLLVVFALGLAGCPALAQSIVKPVPKVPAFRQQALPEIADSVIMVPVTDSVLNTWRAITNIAAYSEPGNILMAGAGLSYQHLKWMASTKKWYCEWSVSAMGWAGGSVAPSTPAQAVSYGIMFGVFNNLVMVGPALNGNKVQAVVSVGINLNN